MGTESSKESKEKNERGEDSRDQIVYRSARAQPQPPVALPHRVYPNIQNELSLNRVNASDTETLMRGSTSHRHQSNILSTPKLANVYPPVKPTSPPPPKVVTSQQTAVAPQRCFAAPSTSAATTSSNFSPIGHIRMTPTAPPAVEVLQNVQTKVPQNVQTKVPQNVQTEVPQNMQTKVPQNVQTKVPQNVQTKVPQNVQTKVTNKTRGRKNVQKIVKNEGETQNAVRSSAPIDNGVVKCCTCGHHFAREIYQCESGHSSCQYCKSNIISCGPCGAFITDMRNFALENQIAEIKTPCRNKSAGCILQFKPAEMVSHLMDCLFAEISCPTNNMFGPCSWKGKILQAAVHLQKCHPEVSQAEVDQELVLTNIGLDNKLMSVVKLGNFWFLVHLQISTAKRNIYMTVQFLGTKQNAARWSYELHVFNKREPRRKFTFSDKCHGILTPIEDIIEENTCAVLALPLAMSYTNEGGITYKFYIKSSVTGAGHQSAGGATRTSLT